MWRIATRFAALAALLSGPSCTGVIGDGMGGEGTGGGAGGGGGAPAGGPQPGPAPLRRLSRTEYDNTVRDLLGVTSQPGQKLTPDGEAFGFDNIASAQTMTRQHADEYMSTAEELARAAVARLASLLPCDPAAVGEPACARTFLAAFGKRAFRRPLAAGEIDRYAGLYAFGAQQGGFKDGIRLVLQGLLQSPAFLYRVEAAEMVTPVVAYEMASRLSYLLWGTMPDDALFAAADAGRLGTADDIRAQALRMLSDPRAREAVASFQGQWFRLRELDGAMKDARLHPGFDALRGRLAAESAAFLDHVFWQGDGRIATLLTAPYSFLDATLATFYGVTGAGSASLEKVPLDPARRAGILTQAAVLALTSEADRTSPVQRGKYVLTRLLCDPPADPPAGVPITPPRFDPGATTRQKFAEHVQNPACAACHVKMDGIGFGFESYDAVGRWRDTENGLPIDASGELVGTEDADGPFLGVPALARRLAGSRQVHDCVVRQWFRFANGRGETAEDEGSLERLRQTLRADGGGMRGLPIALTETDAFRYRRVSEGGAP